VTDPDRLHAVHFERLTAAMPAGHQTVVVRVGQAREIGRLDYRVCHPCQLGYIERIAVVGSWQRKGLGRDALHTALAPCPGYAWSTSRQSPEGRRFFAAMAEESDVAFPPRDARCSHMLCANPETAPAAISPARRREQHSASRGENTDSATHVPRATPLDNEPRPVRQTDGPSGARSPTVPPEYS
jgi:hypothetical protein